MLKYGLISDHIVLTDSSFPVRIRYPRRGIILIQEELIFDVILLEDTQPLCNILEEYRDWNPIDLSEYYISPGVIQLNNRTEWESISSMSWQAVEGGVTLMVVEKGYYHNTEDSKKAVCDIISVKVINEGTVIENINQDCVIKAYLFSPAPGVGCVNDIENIIYISEKLDKPLLIDANLPNPRMLYMASPMRLENVEERTSARLSSFDYFAGGFHEEIQSSSEDEGLGSNIPFRTSSHNPPQTLQASKMNYIEDFMRELNLEMPLTSKNGSEKFKSVNIFDDLNKRIKHSENLFEDFHKAESSSYSHAGSTYYGTLDRPRSLSPLSSHQEKNSVASLDEPLTPKVSLASRIQSRALALNIKPLITKNAPEIKPCTDYSIHLANYPLDWETDGVKKILAAIKDSSKVHFTGLSSATALNLIRKAKKKFKGITCEISSTSLCFTSSSIEAGDTRFKNNPPIRNEANNNLLWDLLKMNAIDCITASHASIEPSQKLTSNFLTAFNGISASGCAFQSVWYILNKTMVDQNALEHYIVRLAKWFSLNPAKILGVSDKRGSIFAGKYADLIVWKPKEKYKLDHQYSYFKTSPFVGKELMGKVYKVFVRGSLVYEIPEQEILTFTLKKHHSRL